MRVRVGVTLSYLMRTYQGGNTMGELRGKYIVNEAGQKTDIILPMDEYEELLEDLHDLAVIAERKDESTVSFDELKRKLRADGIL